MLVSNKNIRVKQFLFVTILLCFWVLGYSQPFKKENEYTEYLLRNIESRDFIEGVWKFTYRIGSGMKNRRGEQLLEPMNIQTEERIAIIKLSNGSFFCFTVDAFLGNVYDTNPIWKNLVFESTAVEGQYLYELTGKYNNGEGKAYIKSNRDLFFECKEEKDIPNSKGAKDWSYLGVTATKVAPTAAEIRKHKNQSDKEENYSEPKFSYGTGFSISNNLIMTCYHVIKNANQVLIRGINGRLDTTYTAQINFYDDYSDIAILKIENEKTNLDLTPPFSLKQQPTDVGENIFVLGYPLQNTMGQEIKLTTGVISSNSGFLGDTSLFQISAPIQPGNSGGPLFDNNGNLIGMVSAKHKNADNVGYAAKSTLIKNILKKEGMSSISHKSIPMELSKKVKLFKDYIYSIEVTLK